VHHLNLEVGMADGGFEVKFNREAQDLLERLRLERGYLMRDGQSGDWSLWSKRNNFDKPGGRLPACLVKEMHLRDLLKPRPGGGLMPASETARSKVTVAITDPQGRTIAAERREAECALDWLRGRKDQSGQPLISEEQFAAAERLRSDYTLARMEQQTTADWETPIESGLRDRSGSQSYIPLSDRTLAAKQRLYGALSHVGPELSGILLEVCCMASGLENAERLLGLPRRSGKPILQIALTRLARHYGLLPDEAPRLPEGRLHHWATPDYRPQIL
jgi:hypothetical protein